MKTTQSQEMTKGGAFPFTGKVPGNGGQRSQARSSETQHNFLKATGRGSNGEALSDVNIVNKQERTCVSGLFDERPRLGDLLLRSGAVTEDLINLGLNHQKHKGLRLGEALVEQNVITEDVMRQALCQQLNVPFVEMRNLSVDPGLSRLINRNYAQKHRIVPIAKLGRTVTLVMDDPTDAALIEELQEGASEAAPPDDEVPVADPNDNP